MAWYDFQCDKCGAAFEKDMPMGSRSKPRCPACGSARTTKVFSAAGIAFKGSGFYITDSRGPAGTTAKPEAENTPAATEKSSGTEISASPVAESSSTKESSKRREGSKAVEKDGSKK